MTSKEKIIFRYHLRSLILGHDDTKERKEYAKELIKEIEEEEGVSAS